MTWELIGKITDYIATIALNIMLISSTIHYVAIGAGGKAAITAAVASFVLVGSLLLLTLKKGWFG